MFPIAEDKLPIRKIADFWAREIPASAKELRELLEKAWWRGELIGTAAKSRLEMLLYLHRAGGIVFLVGEDTGPTEIEKESYNADTGLVTLVFGNRPHVPVPSGKPDDWTEAECEPAFEALAAAWPTIPEKSYMLFAPFFMFIELAREEFLRWVVNSGYERPRFWGSLTEETTASLNATVANASDKHKRKRNPEKEAIRRNAIETVLAAARKMFSDDQIREWTPHRMSKMLVHGRPQNKIASYGQSAIERILKGDLPSAQRLGIAGIKAKVRVPKKE